MHVFVSETLQNCQGKENKGSSERLSSSDRVPLTLTGLDRRGKRISTIFSLGCGGSLVFLARDAGSCSVVPVSRFCFRLLPRLRALSGGEGGAPYLGLFACSLSISLSDASSICPRFRLERLEGLRSFLGMISSSSSPSSSDVLRFVRLRPLRRYRF